MNKKYYISMFLALALLCSACIKENTEDCFSGLKLSFDFSLHTDQPGNLFGSNVRVVRVYCFDEQGTLRHIQEESGEILTNDYVMDVDLAPGKYTIIAWGGSRDKLFNTYHQAAKNSPTAQSQEVKIGQTTRDQLWMIMNSSPAGSLPEAIVPTENELDDLYYGAVGVRNPQTSVYNFELIEVTNEAITERRVELIRNTNILKVTVTGIEHLGQTVVGDFKVWAVTNNSEYGYDNAIAQNTPTIRYTPYSIRTDATSVAADIKKLRLDIDLHHAEPILLHIEAPDGRKFPAKPIDVVKTLLLARDPKTQAYIYNHQSDFDKIYEHPIEVRIGSNLGITIFIGEWEIVYVSPA